MEEDTSFLMDLEVLSIEVGASSCFGAPIYWIVFWRALRSLGYFIRPVTHFFFTCLNLSSDFESCWGFEWAISDPVMMGFIGEKNFEEGFGNDPSFSFSFS